MYAGITDRQCKIPQGSDLTETQKLLERCVTRAGQSEWIVGGQWDAPALGRIPDRSDLDPVSAGHPVYLEDTSGHSVWVNSKALALSGITRSTPDPTGGIIERNASGEPTGILRESATALVSGHIPKPGVSELRSALKASLDAMLSFGITSYTEAAVGFVSGASRELETYAQLADAGEIRQRVVLCITWSPSDPEGEHAIELRNFYARANIAPSCVKIFLDGVPTDSHTAAMLEPYAQAIPGRNDRAARYGLLLVKQDVLNEAVTRFDRMGLTVKFHAAGDAAVRAGLDAIAAARKANGFSSQMHNVGHCTFVDPADIARARSIGATFEVSPYLWGPTPINAAITAAVGPVLIRRVWPVREMLAAGALVVPGSDWSVVPSVNPWPAIETLVTRKAPGGGPESFGGEEAISLPQAIELFTGNAARQEGMADRVGRIEIGMLADVIVLDRDPYRIPAADVHETKVLMTFIAGELAYAAREPSSRPADADPH
jgi:predicted amidohydrolase YtcJ